MSGWVKVAGLGPGAEAMVTDQVRAALAEATDVIGYIPYVARVAPREGLQLLPSDNREELMRAREGLRLAAEALVDTEPDARLLAVARGTSTPRAGSTAAG